MALIELVNLGKTFNYNEQSIDVLKSINLVINQGEMLAILGSSGSGKSTLLHLLGCLDKPSKGHYRLDSQEINQLDDNQLALLRSFKIGFIFQAYNLIPQLNVYDNVALPFYYQKCFKNISEKVKSSLEKVGLSHRLYHSARLLSGGEMQRVAIARALAADPLLILADEPTGNLDYDNCQNVLKLLKDLNSEGKTIIMVTHDLNVANHCKRMITLVDGVIQQDCLR